MNSTDLPEDEEDHDCQRDHRYPFNIRGFIHFVSPFNYANEEFRNLQPVDRPYVERSSSFFYVLILSIV